MAELRFSRPNIIPSSKTVMFYALDAEAAARVRALASAFAATLPPGTELAVVER